MAMFDSGARRLFLTGALAALLVVLAAPPSAQADESAGHLAIGERVSDLRGQELGGGTLRFADLEVTAEKAEAAVREAAASVGLPKDAPLTKDLASFDALRGEGGGLDRGRVRELLVAAGRPFGLVPSDRKVREVTTLAEVFAWVVDARDAPLLVSVWSPNCSVCKNIYDAKVNAFAAEQGLRFVAVGANANDSSEQMRSYVEENGYAWRVVVDPQQQVANRLGATRTPHFFLLDTEGTLRYAGTFDDDPREKKDAGQRRTYLADAVAAVYAGKRPDVQRTEPAG